MTVGELKRMLDDYDEDMKIVFNHQVICMENALDILKKVKV